MGVSIYASLLIKPSLGGVKRNLILKLNTKKKTAGLEHTLKFSNFPQHAYKIKLVEIISINKLLVLLVPQTKCDSSD